MGVALGTSVIFLGGKEAVGSVIVGVGVGTSVCVCVCVCVCVERDLSS